MSRIIQLSSAHLCTKTKAALDAAIANNGNCTGIIPLEGLTAFQWINGERGIDITRVSDSAGKWPSSMQGDEDPKDFEDLRMAIWLAQDQKAEGILFPKDGPFSVFLPIFVDGDEDLSELNTWVEYMYRDPGNCKVYEEVTFRGIIRERNFFDQLLEAQEEGTWFRPGDMGLPVPQFEDYDPEYDHELCEIVDAEMRASPASESMTIQEFLEKLKEQKAERLKEPATD